MILHPVFSIANQSILELVAQQPRYTGFRNTTLPWKIYLKMVSGRSRLPRKQGPFAGNQSLRCSDLDLLTLSDTN